VVIADDHAIVRKGTEVEFESYSGFHDDGGNQTLLHHILQAKQIERVIIYGIATDYCVRATALDALQLGYQVVMIKGLSRGIGLETAEKAIEELRRAGAEILESIDSLF
jgi:nicotinamidase/pyrazinamidase